MRSAFIGRYTLKPKMKLSIWLTMRDPLPTNCLSVLDHFVELVLKELKTLLVPISKSYQFLNVFKLRLKTRTSPFRVHGYWERTGQGGIRSFLLLYINMEPVWIAMSFFNPLSANPTQWSNRHKQFVGNLPTNWMCLTILWYWSLKGKTSLESSSRLRHWL